MNRIIDISQWNTVTDWDAVKQNVDAVIIRAGFTYSKNGYLCVDNNYTQNRKACKQRNIPYSLYFFTNAVTEEEAEREANFVAYECRDMARFVLPVFVDSETVGNGGRADDLDIPTRTKCLRAFCSTLQRNNVPAGIYCNPDWIQHHIDRSQLPFSLWLAHWGDAPAYDDYTLWQYTNCASVPGIVGRVDMSTNEKQNKSIKEKIVELLLSEEGYHEKKTGNFLYTDQDSGSNNYTKYGYELHRLQPYNMDYPAAWCMAFISWGFVEICGLNEAKRRLCGDIDDYTVTAAQRFIDAGRWFQEPEVGDLIFFGVPSIHHVGMVYKVANGNVYTVEGNSNDAVRKHTYRLTNKNIAGYGRPIY